MGLEYHEHGSVSNEMITLVKHTMCTLFIYSRTMHVDNVTKTEEVARLLAWSYSKHVGLSEPVH